MSQLSEKGLTLNTRRLLLALESRGVCFPEDVSNFYIHRNLGQAMMNKAAGELGPTWELMRDGEQMGRGGTQNGRDAEVEWEGRKFPQAQEHGQGQRGRKDQSGIGHQAVVIEGDLHAVGVVAW